MEISREKLKEIMNSEVEMLEFLQHLGIEIEPDSDKNWKPEFDERYVSFFPFQKELEARHWKSSNREMDLLRLGRVARTEEQAELYKTQEEAWRKLWDLSDYDDGIDCYYIAYSEKSSAALPFLIEEPTWKFLSPSFKSRESALEALNNVGEELIAGYIKRMSATKRIK